MGRHVAVAAAAYRRVSGARAARMVGRQLRRRHVGAVQRWTLYGPPPPRRYADYLPAAHTAWFPGIVEYVGIGLAAGLVVAAALAALRFRLVRVPRAT